MTGLRVVVVGGGAAGTLAAVHLLRRGGPGLSVTVVEPRETLGHGVAFGTPDPWHRLNVPAITMSGLPEDLDHFRAFAGCAPDDFPPRHVFGEYLGALLADAAAASPGAFEHVRARATRRPRRRRGCAAARRGARRRSGPRRRRRRARHGQRAAAAARVPRRGRRVGRPAVRRRPVGTRLARRHRIGGDGGDHRHGPHGARPRGIAAAQARGRPRHRALASRRDPACARGPVAAATVHARVHGRGVRRVRRPDRGGAGTLRRLSARLAPGARLDAADAPRAVAGDGRRDPPAVRPRASPGVGDPPLAARPGRRARRPGVGGRGPAGAAPGADRRRGGDGRPGCAC